MEFRKYGIQNVVLISGQGFEGLLKFGRQSKHRRKLTSVLLVDEFDKLECEYDTIRILTPDVWLRWITTLNLSDFNRIVFGKALKDRQFFGSLVGFSHTVSGACAAC